MSDAVLGSESQAEVGWCLETLYADWPNLKQADAEEKCAFPMHPRCFEMFKKLSIQRRGKVDIDGLWKLRDVSRSPLR